MTKIPNLYKKKLIYQGKKNREDDLGRGYIRRVQVHEIRER